MENKKTDFQTVLDFYGKRITHMFSVVKPGETNESRYKWDMSHWGFNDDNYDGSKIYLDDKIIFFNNKGELIGYGLCLCSSQAPKPCPSINTFKTCDIQELLIKQ